MSQSNSDRKPEWVEDAIKEIQSRRAQIALLEEYGPAEIQRLRSVVEQYLDFFNRELYENSSYLEVEEIGPLSFKITRGDEQYETEVSLNPEQQRLEFHTRGIFSPEAILVIVDTNGKVSYNDKKGSYSAGALARMFIEPLVLAR